MEGRPVLCVKVNATEEELSLILAKVHDEDDLKRRFGCCCTSLKYRRLGDYVVVTDEDQRFHSSCNWFSLYGEKADYLALVYLADGTDMKKSDLEAVTLQTNFKVKQPRIQLIHDDD